MNLTRQQKVLLGVLGVGAGALAVDRFWLSESQSGPQSASAEVVTMSETRASSTRELDAWLADADDTLVTFTFIDRLDALVEARATGASRRDAFTPPTGWLDEQGTDAGGSDAEQQSVAQQFRAAHRLDAVMMDHQGGVAVIDGRAVRVGQHLDGYKLVEVQQKQVLFDAPVDNLRVALPLRAPVR